MASSFELGIRTGLLIPLELGQSKGGTWPIFGNIASFSLVTVVELSSIVA